MSHEILHNHFRHLTETLEGIKAIAYIDAVNVSVTEALKTINAIENKISGLDETYLPHDFWSNAKTERRA